MGSRSVFNLDPKDWGETEMFRGEEVWRRGRRAPKPGFDTATDTINDVLKVGLVRRSQSFSINLAFLHRLAHIYPVVMEVTL